MNDKLALIIDSNSLCYRSFYTLPELSTQEVPIFVVYGFIRQVFRLAKEFETNQFIFCWDSKVNHRKEIFPEYKLKRTEDKDPEHIAKLVLAFNQFNFIRREVLPKLGFRNIFCQSGFEADDIMAQITIDYPDRNFVIVSGDMDMLQCLTDKVSQWTYKKLISKKTFTKIYGIDPSLWASAKAIGGCNSDGVPGIKGIADPAKSKSQKMPAISLASGQEVTARLLEKYNDPENQKLIQRNLQLITLPFKTDKYQLDKMTLEEDDLTRDSFWEVFLKLDFKSCLSDFTNWMNRFDLK